MNFFNPSYTFCKTIQLIKNNPNTPFSTSKFLFFHSHQVSISQIGSYISSPTFILYMNFFNPSYTFCKTIQLIKNNSNTLFSTSKFLLQSFNFQSHKQFLTFLFPHSCHFSSPILLIFSVKIYCITSKSTNSNQHLFHSFNLTKYLPHALHA